MFLPFFETLRSTGVPVSLREYLSFLDGMAAGLVTYDVDGCYYLARSDKGKDEPHLDRSDRAFAEAVYGREPLYLHDGLTAVTRPRHRSMTLA